MGKFTFFAIVWALFLGEIQSHATIDAALQMQLGNPTGALADTNNHSHYLIQRTVEALDYNDTYGEPNWASWDLTDGDIGSSGRSSNFFADTNLPSNFFEVNPNDYSGSGYDRGHMCPSDDRTDSTNDNNLVFLMSNMIPQNGNVNSGVWGNLESYCRFLAQSNNDEVLITCGPGGFDGSRINTNGYVWIPQYCWKIIVVVPPGSGTALSRITAASRVIAVEIPNTNVTDTVWQDFVTSVNQIQLDTGYTFFTALPTDVAAALRSKVDGQTSGLLAGWDVSTSTNYGISPLPPSTNAANITISGLVRGVGINAGGTGGLTSGGWGGTGFTATTEAAAVTANDFFTFSLMASNNFKISFNSISEFDYRRSSTGPTNGVLQYQIDSGVFIDITNFAYSSSATKGAMLDSIDLSGIAALQNVGANTNVTFRIVNYGGKSTGSWYVYNYLGNSSPDFEIQGTVAQVINLPALAPVISGLLPAGQSFGFTVSGTTGSNYLVEAATNLNMPVWVPLMTNAAPFFFIDTKQLSQRFYRAVLP